MHAISDPLLKQVVAILKDEVNRYRECGRPVGGLGSVRVTYANRTLNGVGYQGRETNSPRRQWLVPDPQNASVHSDNLDALMSLFESEDEAGKRLMIDALVDRISLGNEYTPIGYFFLLSLFKMGEINTALHVIAERLKGDQKYGFDDAVRMLSGLLQYEYPKFSDAELDEIERFMEGLEGHLHQLKERYIAARAVRYGSLEVQPVSSRTD